MRGLGAHKPKFPPHEHKASFRLHPAMAATIPPARNLKADGHTSPCKDQGQTSSCEAHRASMCINTTLSAHGTPLGWIVSEEDCYKSMLEAARARETPASMPLPDLQDSGGYTEDMFQAVSAFGVRARTSRAKDGRESDCNPVTADDKSLVTDQTLGDLEADAAELVAGEYAIEPSAPDAVHQICAAIAAGIACGIDFFVDSDFETWGDVWTPALPPLDKGPNENDPNGGGHAISVVAYKTMPDGQVIFGLLNSWGTDVGDGGVWWVTSRWLLRAAWGISVWNVKFTSANMSGGAS